MSERFSEGSLEQLSPQERAVLHQYRAEGWSDGLAIVFVLDRTVISVERPATHSLPIVGAIKSLLRRK